MHVVLLAAHGEVLQPGGDGIGVIDDMHAVVDDPSGMSHPLAADHELVIRLATEGVAHSTVQTGKAHSAFPHG